MSLVAYGASDSDNSDSENEVDDTKGQQQQTLEATNISQIPSNHRDNDVNEAKEAETSSSVGGNISDEDEYEGVSSTSTLSYTSSRPSPHLQVSKQSTEDQINSTSVTSLDDLPAPQVRTSDVTNTLVEEDLEEEVKVKAAEIASAPKPPGKKTKQAVKITIPSLDENSDDEDNAELRKNVSSTSKSSLFSLLPAPIHSAKKEINRPLIPHTLTKKAAPPKKPMTSVSASQKSVNIPSASKSEVASSSEASSKRMSQFNALTGYDSDSDDDNDTNASSSNFFSLTSTSKDENPKDTSLPSLSSSRVQSGVVSSSKADSNSGSDIAGKPKLSSVEPSSSDEVKVTNSKNNISVGSTEEQMEEEEVVSQPEPGSFNDAPLDFGASSRHKSWSSTSSSYFNPVGVSGPVGSLPDFQNPYALPSNNVYNLANTENADNYIQDTTDEVPNDDLKQFMSDKEFQRFQGKRKRGMEESINFVDANVDDYVDPSEVTKHLTEESEYVSHKSKDNMPTSQQKRKKQITYLAYQAKERELELKNSWAMNKQTKMQTQSKYGF